MTKLMIIIILPLITKIQSNKVFQRYNKNESKNAGSAFL